MATETLAEYKYLWDGSSPGWVLLKEPDVPGEYSVFHKTNRTLLHIESNSIKTAVCRKMKESGCEILDDIPPGNAEVSVSPI